MRRLIILASVFFVTLFASSDGYSIKNQEDRLLQTGSVNTQNLIKGLSSFFLPWSGNNNKTQENLKQTPSSKGNNSNLKTKDPRLALGSKTRPTMTKGGNLPLSKNPRIYTKTTTRSSTKTATSTIPSKEFPTLKAEKNSNVAGTANSNQGSLSATDSKRLLELVNNLRSKNNVPSIKYNAQLNAAALVQADYMASINAITHDNSNFPTFLDRIKASDAPCNEGCGENVAAGYNLVDKVFTGWSGSPNHRKNMLGPNYNSMGVAVVDTYWAQEFGSE